MNAAAIVAIMALVGLLVVGLQPARGQAGAASPPAAACAERGKALDHLARKYGEAAVARGLASNGGLVELLTAADGETWSLLITLPDGVTCLIAAGESWERLKRPGPVTPRPIRSEDHDWITSNPKYVDRNDTHCCGPSHCQPARRGEIERIEGGWRHVATGTVVRDGEKGDYTTQDPYGRMYRCVYGGILRCVFTGTGI